MNDALACSRVIVRLFDFYRETTDDDEEHLNIVIGALKLKFQEKQIALTKFRRKLNEFLGYVPIECYDNLEYAIKVVQSGVANLMQAFSDRVRNHRKLQFEKVKQNPTKWPFLKGNDNREILKYAISQPNFGYLLKLASPRLRQDPELIEIASSNGLYENYRTFLWYDSWMELDINEPEERKIVKLMLSRNGDLFEILDHMHSDRELALIAIQHNILAIHFISDELKKDREFILEAIKSSIIGKGFNRLDRILEEWADDRQVLLEMCKLNSNLLKFSHYDWKSDDEFILELIYDNPMNLEFVPDKFKSDRSVVLELVKKCGMVLRLVGMELRNDKDIMLEAIRNNALVYQYASDELRYDRDIVLESLIGSHLVYHLMPPSFRYDTDIVIRALKSGLDYHEIVGELKQDRDFILEVCKIGRIEYPSIPIEFVSDFEILSAFIQNNSFLTFKFDDLPKNFRESKELLLKLIKRIVPKVIMALPMELRTDKEFAFECVKANLQTIHQIDSSVIKSDFILRVIEINKQVLKYCNTHVIRFPIAVSAELFSKYGIFDFSVYSDMKNRLFLSRINKEYPVLAHNLDFFK